MRPKAHVRRASLKRVTLRDLAHFTIRTVKPAPNKQIAPHGEFDHLVGVRYWRSLREWRGYLYKSSRDFILGSKLDRRTKKAVMVAWPERWKPRAGDAVPFFDYEWDPAQVSRALKPLSSWKKSIVKPVDQVRYRDPKVPGYWASHLASAPVANGATDVHMVKKGWDHEHCYLCLARIGRKGDAFGYFCKPDSAWACEPCFKAYIAARNLSLLIETPPRR